MNEITSYIMLWTFLSATASTVTGGMILYADRNKNPWYLIPMSLAGATVGIFLAGIYIAFTWGLDELQLWALMIPIVFGSFTAFALAIILPKLPSSFRSMMSVEEVRPLSIMVALIVVIGLGFVSVLPALPSSTGETYPATSQVDYFSTNIIYPTTNSVSVLGNGYTVNLNEEQIKTLEINPTIPITVKTAHSSVDFPTRIASDPEEGDVMGWRITFSVASNSPVAWKKPVICMYYWGDTNGNGQYDSGEPILGDENGFNLWTAAPTASSPAYWRAPAVWMDGTTPAFMLYQFADGSNLQLLPIHYAKSLGQWKDDAGETFPQNLKDGYTAPYDMWSWSWDRTSGTIQAEEEILEYQSISAGSSTTLEGKLYCPSGMANVSSTWNLRIIMFDLAYSTDEPINTYDMQFSVGGGGPGPTPPQPPIVDATSEYWVATAGLLTATLAGFYVVTKYGYKIIA